MRGNLVLCRLRLKKRTEKPTDTATVRYPLLPNLESGPTKLVISQRAFKRTHRAFFPFSPFSGRRRGIYSRPRVVNKIYRAHSVPVSKSRVGFNVRQRCQILL